MTTIALALTFAVLGHDRCWVREQAEGRLCCRPATMADYNLSARLAGSDPDPEVRHRAGRVARRWLCRVVDTLLPDDVLFWPDIDHARRWTETGVIERPCCVWEWAPGCHGWPFPGYRRAFRSGVVGYLSAGGDWSVAREMVRDVCREEAEHAFYGPRYRDPGVFDLWSMLVYAPECIRGNRCLVR